MQYQVSCNKLAALKMSPIKPKENISKKVPLPLQVKSQQQLKHSINSIYYNSGQHHSTVHETILYQH